jgi:hypothetical protein
VAFTQITYACTDHVVDLNTGPAVTVQTVLLDG